MGWEWGIGGGGVVVVIWRIHCGAGSAFVAVDESLSLYHEYAHVNFSPLFSSCYIRLICVCACTPPPPPSLSLSLSPSLPLYAHMPVCLSLARSLRVCVCSSVPWTCLTPSCLGRGIGGIGDSGRFECFIIDDFRK